MEYNSEEYTPDLSGECNNCAFFDTLSDCDNVMKQTGCKIDEQPITRIVKP